MSYQPLTNNQIQLGVNIRQTYDAYREVRKRVLRYPGQMTWKTVRGQEYLIQRIRKRQDGQQQEMTRSHGKRSPETEKMYRDFHEGKRRAVEMEKQLARTMGELAGMARGVRLNRVPSIVTAMLRALDDHGLLGKNLTVVGTHVLYAYESVAGVYFGQDDPATTDIDLLRDARSNLRLALSPELNEKGVLGLLRSVDKSFEPVRPRGYSAVNADGFLVDLIKPAANPPWKVGEPEQIGQAHDDLVAGAIGQLKWLASSPKFSAVVIGQDGYPAPMVCPDPRAFALYKLWMSEQQDRDPDKRERDVSQAMAVAQLVQDRFPHLPFDESELRAFPKPIARKAGEPFRFGL